MNNWGKQDTIFKSPFFTLSTFWTKLKKEISLSRSLLNKVLFYKFPSPGKKYQNKVIWQASPQRYSVFQFCLSTMSSSPAPDNKTVSTYTC